MNIGFIGLGKLGLPCAEVIAKKGHSVYGYDIDLKSSELVTIVDNIKDCVVGKEIIFVAVPTPHDQNYDGSFPTSHLKPKDFDYESVKLVLQQADKFMNQNQYLVLISTVLPGTTKQQLSRLVKNSKLIYNPYLIAMGSVEWDMVNPEMVIIGSQNIKDTEKIVEFYQTIMENNPRYILGTWEECECIKVFYNTMISAKISLVNMMLDVSEKLGNIDVDVVTGALANSSMRITGPKYMTAGMGDAGPCHPRDNIALRFLSKKLNLGYDLFDSIMKSRERQAENLAKKLVRIAKKNSMSIFIHGKSYKPNVVYCDGSYSLLVGNYCKKLGVEPTYIDPLTGDDICGVYGVVLMAHNSGITYGKEHKQKTYCKIEKGSIVVDPWRTFDKNTNGIKVIYYGNTRNDILQ